LIFTKAVINANISISSKNVIASTLNSLYNEPIIRAHLLFVKGYHDSFFSHNFNFMKRKDSRARLNGFNSHHMSFVEYASNNLSPSEQNIHLDAMPKAFFFIAQKMLFKHFNQWIESPLLPLTLAGEDFSAQALAQYIMSELGEPLTSQAQLPSSYYSEIQNAEIPLIPMIDFFTANLDKEQFLKSNFISLPHPSNNQIVEAGVRDVSLCRNSGRGERLSSMLSFYRSTITETLL
jgi:hypothetical protein